MKEDRKNFKKTIKSSMKKEMLSRRDGYFGAFGGRYVPEILVSALQELEKNYFKYKKDKEFKRELSFYLKNYKQ
jgi:tryptophan synthase beta chain